MLYKKHYNPLQPNPLSQYRATYQCSLCPRHRHNLWLAQALPPGTERAFGSHPPTQSESSGWCMPYPWPRSELLVQPGVTSHRSQNHAECALPWVPGLHSELNTRGFWALTGNCTPKKLYMHPHQPRESEVDNGGTRTRGRREYNSEQ